NGSVYIASAASRVALHPAANVDLVGLSTDLVHLRGTLDLVGVEAEFVRRDEYKAAVEQFTRTEPSEAQVEQTEALLDDLFDELVGGLAEGRGLAPERVRETIDGGPYTAEEAL